MQIHGYNHLTLLDYPGRLACTIFTGSCNFRCPFCHNATLVLNPSAQPQISEEEIFAHLLSRRSVLEGICVTGGEPTLNSDLPDFLKKLRETGLRIKLDTNGSNPDMLEKIISQGLIDYMAMDIKSSPAGYARCSGLKDIAMDNIFASTELIMNSGIEYEFRTTVVEGLHNSEDFIRIGHWLRGAQAYYLQQYKESSDLIAPEGLSSPTPETLKYYRDTLLPFIPNTFIRGTE